jgi:ribosomal protein L7/L12
MATVLLLLIAVAFILGFVLARGARGDRGKAADPPSHLPDAATTLDDDSFKALVQREATSGRMIEAIKLYRQRTGLGLKESKDAVEALVAGAAGADFGMSTQPPAALDDETFATQLLVELAAGRKIEAIKLYRERTGLGLKEAKDAIDDLERGA